MKRLLLTVLLFSQLAFGSYVTSGSGGNTLGLSCSSGQVPSWSGAGFTVCLSASGSGTVTSVNTDSTTSSIFTNTTNVIGTAVVTMTLLSQTKNTLLAGPTTGSNAVPAFRALVGADLPNPGASSLGGIQSLAAVTSNWIRSISTSGVPAASQPAFTDISGTLAIGSGGTGQTTATAAINALLPSQGGVTSGWVLQTNGTNTSWAAPGAGGGITAGTGDVTFSGSGSVATTVAQIAGVAVGTPSGTGNVLFSASPTTTGTLTAAAINASGKVAGSNATSFTASGSTYTYDMTATTSLFGRIGTAADTGTITWQSNTATTSDTHGGAWIRMTANDASATNSGSLDLGAYGTGGATTNQITFNARSGANTSNVVATIVNGGFLMASGKNIQMAGSSAFTSGSGSNTLNGQTAIVNHGLYAGNTSFSVDTRAFSRIGYGNSGDLAGVTEYGVWLDPSPKTSATTQWSQIYSYVNGTTGTVAFTEMNGLFIDVTNLSTNNTATHLNQIKIAPPTAGLGTMTNGASIADNITYTGTYFINSSSANPSVFGGNVSIALTKTLSIVGGTNGCHGQATLASGTVTVSTTCTPSSSQDIFISDGGGTVTNIGSISVGTVTASTSFVINSSNVLDSSLVSWVIMGH